MRGRDQLQRSMYRCMPMLLLLMPLAMGMRSCEKIEVGQCLFGDCITGASCIQPGASFPADDGCNICTCGDDLVVSCTDRSCSNTCAAPGVPFMAADGCNLCTCDPQGVVSCTDMVCGDPLPSPCGAPGVPFPTDDGCNTCTCYGDGSIECTARGCSDITCTEPGTSFMAEDGCNVCACGPKGVISCTNVPCGASSCTDGPCNASAEAEAVPVPRNTPGVPFPTDDGCNICICHPDGSIECTANDCSKPCGPESLPCADGEYCHVPDGLCGGAERFGFCEPVPENCKNDLLSICGCDGNSYENRCDAASVGVAVAYDGPCSDSLRDADLAAWGGSAAAGGSSDTPRASAAAGGSSDAPRASAAAGGGSGRPELCNYQGDFFSIGESFMTLDGCNQCTCLENGLVTCTDRDCGAEVCGGLAGLPCLPDQFCDFPISTECGFGDQFGRCRDIPTFCTDQFKPVCGCDGETYSNACEAAAAGVSVATEGACD